MKILDAKYGEVTLDFQYEKEKNSITVHRGQKKTVLQDKTICTFQIGNLVVIISEVFRYYKDKPNRIVGRKQALDSAWKTLKTYLPEKTDRQRIWSEIMSCGMKLN
jgi:hypothetical protein